MFLAADSVNTVDIIHEDVRNATTPGFEPDYALKMNGRGTLNGSISTECNLQVELCTLNLTSSLWTKRLTVNSGTINAKTLMVSSKTRSDPLIVNGGAIHLTNPDSEWMRTLELYLTPHTAQLDSSKFHAAGKSGAAVQLSRDEFYDEWSDNAYYSSKEPELTITAPGAAAVTPPKDLSLKLKYDTYELPATFSESYFAKSSYTYNHDLAWLTLCLELSAYSANETGIWGEDGGDYSSTARQRYANIADAYHQMSFDTAEYYNYGSTLNNTADKAAYSIGTKKLSDGSTLITAVVRGGGYGAEWSSNFHLTEQAMKSGYHQGFYTAASQVYQTLTRKIAGISGPAKVWITGYSRGAATANILAGLLDDYAAGVSNLSPESIYAYTFATPSGVLPAKNPSAAKYANIFNIVNPGDIVPMVAPARWNYTRYGTTLTFDAEAGYSITSQVDAAHRALLRTSSDPAVAFKGQESSLPGVLSLDTFHAGSNAKYGKTHQAVIGALMNTYSTENSARGFLDAVSDLMSVAYSRTRDGSGWRKLTLREAMDTLGEKYGVGSVSAAYEKAQESSEAFRSLAQDLTALGTKFGLEATDLVILINTVAEVHDVSLTDLVGILWEIANAVKVEDNSLKNKLLDKASGIVTNVTDSYAEGFSNFLEMVEHGHTPLTYLAWMKLTPGDIFGHTSYSSGSGSSGGGSSGGGGRDAVPSGWAQTEVNAAVDALLVPSDLQAAYQSPVTREAVSDMFVALIEETTGLTIDEVLAALKVSINVNAFSDTQNASVLAMNALGIINGTGSGKFSPDGTLTRAQIAAIINRVAKVLGENTAGYTHSFTDVAGSWVDSELGWPASVGIINGVGDGRFNPNGVLTTEQAILIAYRALEALGK